MTWGKERPAPPSIETKIDLLGGPPLVPAAG
jgi:hypothetical protein